MDENRLIEEEIKYVELLINARFGRFDYSDAFYDAYNKYMDAHTDVSRKNEDYNGRGGVNVIIAKEMGLEKAAGLYCKLRIVKVPAFMAPYFALREYDGFESVNFDVAAFWRDLVNHKNDPVEIVRQMNKFMSYYEKRK